MATAQPCGNKKPKVRAGALLFYTTNEHLHLCSSSNLPSLRLLRRLSSRDRLLCNSLIPLPRSSDRITYARQRRPRGGEA